MKEMVNRRKMQMTVMGALMLPVILIGIVSLIVLQLITKGSLTVFGGTISILVLMAGAVCLLSVLAKGVSGRILEFTENLDQAAEEKLALKEGKLSEREKELGEILRSMNCMAGNIAPVITDVKHASASLREISEEFNQSFQEMAASMEQMDSEVGTMGENTISQAGHIRELSDQIVEIQRVADGILEHAEILEESTEKIKGYSGTAGQSMEELMKISEAGSQAVTEIQAQAEEANQSVEQIRAVGEMIAGISSQANLVALNISIEAARAGKMGREFVSVADEIRGFADQSREASEQINAIAKALEEGFRSKAENNWKVEEACKEQAEKIFRTKEVFVSMNREVERISAAVCEIGDQAAKLKGSDEIFDTDIVTLPEPVQEKTMAGEQIDHIGSFKITDFRK